MGITKQRSSAAKNVAIFFIIFLILEGLIIFGINWVFKDKDSKPSIAGYTMYIMESDAMGDAVPKGSLVVATNGAPSVEGVKKAILAENVQGVGTSVFWLADVSTSADLNGVVYTVFQEKNPTRLFKIMTKDIIGTATSYYQTAGKIITFMTSKFGIIALIAAPLFLFVLLELIIMVVNRVRYAEYDDDDDDEDDEDDGEKPVQLDDFLFGGEHDKELIKDRVRVAEESVEADKLHQTPRKSKPARRVNDDDDFSFVKKEKTEKTVKAEEHKPEPVKAKPAPEPEPEPVPEPEPEENEIEFVQIEQIAPEPKPEPKSEPKPEPKSRKVSEPKAPKAASKNVASSFEDLMKLMEEESNKIKNQLNDK